MFQQQQIYYINTSKSNKFQIAASNKIWPTSSALSIQFNYILLQILMFKNMFISLTILTLLFKQYEGQMCSAYCTYSFNGSAYVPLCTTQDNTGCMACDTNSTLFYFANTLCNFNTTYYKNEVVDLDPSQAGGITLASWTVVPPSPPVGGWAALASATFIDTTYNVLLFTGNTLMSAPYALTNFHYTLKFRMSIIIVGNPTYDFSVIVDGNTASPISVDNSSRAFMDNSSFDSYIWTSSDYPHTAMYVTISLNVYNLIGSFGIKEFMVFSKTCPVGCTACTNATTCTTCKNTPVQYMLSGTTCTVSCLSGYFYNISTPNVCQSCDPSCNTCTNLSTNCTSCSSINALYQFYYNGTCISSCPNGTYYLYPDLICMSCPIGCSICNSSDINYCTNCTQVIGIGTFYLSVTGYGCSLSCPLGQFLGNYSNMVPVCWACMQGCLTCSDGVTCDTCNNYGPNATVYYSFNKSCLSSCPGGNVLNTTTFVCYCLNHTFQQAGFCYSCASVCDTCYGSSASECYSCAVGYFLIQSANTCLSMCPNGYYADQPSRTCFKCNDSCNSCLFSPSNCSGCVNNTYLFSGTCVSICPYGYGSTKSPNLCLKCPDQTYSINNLCLQFCPPGFVASNTSQTCLFESNINQLIYFFNVMSTFVNDGKKMLHTAIFPQSLVINSANIFSQVLMSFYNKRTNVTTNLSILNIQVDSSFKKIYVYTNLPQDIDDYLNIFLNMTFTNNSLISSDNVLYGSNQKFISLNNPKFIYQLYTNYYTTKLDYIGISISCLAFFLIFLSYWNREHYQTCLQYLMTIQAIGLYSFLKYPVGFNMFAFLRGFCYSMMDFLPDLITTALPYSYVSQSFGSYEFRMGDMNYLRILAPTLEAFILAQIPILYLFIYDRNEFKSTIIWLFKTFIYISSLNLIFATVSSLVNLFSNSDNSSIQFILVQLLSFTILIAFAYFNYQQWTSLTSQFWLITQYSNIILLPFLNVKFSLFLILNNLLQVGLLIYYYRICRQKQDKNTNGILCMRICSIFVYNVIFLSNNTLFNICFVTFMLVLNLAIQASHVYQGFSDLIEGTSDSEDKQDVLDEKTMNNLSKTQMFMTQIDIQAENQKHYDQKSKKTSGLYPDIIIEHSVQQSPKRDHKKSEQDKFEIKQNKVIYQPFNKSLYFQDQTPVYAIGANNSPARIEYQQ